MRQVLLTGAKGNLGQALETELLRCGLSVISCDHAALDVTCEDELISAFESTSPDLVVNAAGYNAVA